MPRVLMICLLVVLTATIVRADELDDTYEKVDKHLYGKGKAGSREAVSPAAEEPTPPVKSAPQATAPSDDGGDQGNMQGETEDSHYILADDYMISDQPLGTNTYISLVVAKMKTPPIAKTKGEALFMQIADGQEVWTKYYWKSRPAQVSQVKPGSIVIAFDYSDNDIYRAPENKEEARTSKWFMAKVTDMSDVYKGFVTVSGPYKVSTKNLRIITSFGEQKGKKL